MTISQADVSIGFIGAGRMAQALASGIAQSEQFRDVPVCFIDPNNEAARAFASIGESATRVDCLEEVARQATMILLAVKPQTMPSIFKSLGPSVTDQHLVVSVVAGIPIQTYQEGLGTSRIVRVMPNTPCLIGCGMSVNSCYDSVSQGDRDLVGHLLESVGEVQWVNESRMNAVTGLSGSGPAYVFSMIEAMIQGGIEQGLEPGMARQLTIQTVLGATRLVKSTGQEPAHLREQVSSPGGTTLAGLDELSKAGFQPAIRKAIAAAAQRSDELSQTGTKQA